MMSVCVLGGGCPKLPFMMIETLVHVLTFEGFSFRISVKCVKFGLKLTENSKVE